MPKRDAANGMPTKGVEKAVLAASFLKSAGKDAGSQQAAGDGPAYGILLSTHAFCEKAFVAHLQALMNASDGLAPIQLPGRDSEGEASRLVLVYLSASKLDAAKRDKYTRAQTSFMLMECILDVLSDDTLKKVLPKSFHGEGGESLVKACMSVGYVEAFFPIHDTDATCKIWRSAQRSLSGAPVDEIREYFGEEIAFYFAWVNFYTKGECTFQRHWRWPTRTGTQDSRANKQDKLQ
jgi:hypothetical protein